jgi:release factor glutamine methyltransferase
MMDHKKNFIDLLTNINNQSIKFILKKLQNHIHEQEVWWLLEKVTQKNKASLLTQESLFLSTYQQATFCKWIRQRVEEKKPLQYILGEVSFCGIEVIVEPPILIPRPETEEITQWLINTIDKSGQKKISILDMCTGSGCIGLALAQALPQAKIIAIDNNSKAIALSLKNKILNNLKNILFIESNLFENIEAKKQFNIIISNPPYLSYESYLQTSDEIKLWEDRNALIADDNGMFIYKKIIAQAHNYLKPLSEKGAPPQLILEIGKDQKTIESVVLEEGFKNIKQFLDIRGSKRWITAST